MSARSPIVRTIRVQDPKTGHTRVFPSNGRALSRADIADLSRIVDLRFEQTKRETCDRRAQRLDREREIVSDCWLHAPVDRHVKSVLPSHQRGVNRCQQVSRAIASVVHVVHSKTVAARAAVIRRVLRKAVLSSEQAAS